MTMIRISLNDVKNTNEALKNISSDIDCVNNTVGGLKHSVDSGVQARKDIRNKIYNVEKKLNRIEEEINELYKMINYSTGSYTKTENDICRKLAEMIMKTDRS